MTSALRWFLSLGQPCFLICCHSHRHYDEKIIFILLFRIGNNALESEALPHVFLILVLTAFLCLASLRHKISTIRTIFTSFVTADKWFWIICNYVAQVLRKIFLIQYSTWVLRRCQQVVLKNQLMLFDPPPLESTARVAITECTPLYSTPSRRVIIAAGIGRSENTFLH